MGQPVGLVGLVKRDYLPEPDLGFALLDAYAGRGLAYEAACAVLSLARARKLTRLLAITDPDNRRSIALLQRLGFELEAVQVVPGGTKPCSATAEIWARPSGDLAARRGRALQDCSDAFSGADPPPILGSIG